MATFKLRANELSGETGLTVQLYPPGGTIANGAGGDTLTESSGLFTATVAESLAGFHQYYVYQSSLPIYSGFVYCNGSTWYADRPESRILTLNPARRSADDVNPILFWWPVASDTFSAKTVTITENGTTGSSANVQGAITATGESVVDSDGRTWYKYSLAYDADDRPSGQGIAEYVLTGTGYVGYLTLEVSPSVANLSLITPEGVVYLEGATTNIKLKIGSTKEKTHYTEAGTNLTGKTLKLYIETKPGVFFEEISVTGGASGAFTFTPSSTLTASVHNYPAALREPSDGNNVLWHGLIEVGYAADGA